MATRLYFSDAVASPVNPAFGGWGESSEAVRRAFLKAKSAGEALSLGTRIGWAAGVTQLDRQYVSPQMAAGLVFDTAVTYKCQLAAREFNNGDNSTSRMMVKIVSEDGGTVRITILAIGQYGPATELINNATLRNKTYADGDAGTGSYTTVAGDRLVVEIGYADAAGTTPEGQARYGAPTGTADHGENETETTSLVPWFETSLNITWGALSATIGQVTETDAAQAVGRGKSIGQVAETDLAQPFSLFKSVTIGQVLETDLAQVVGRARSISQVSEIDLAQAMTGAHQATIGEVFETDIAQPFTSTGGSYGLGSDRRVHRTRKPTVVRVAVVGRKHPVLALIEKQKLAGDARIEQQRMAAEQTARRDALYAEAQGILDDIKAREERAAVIREKRMRNLALAEAARRRNEAERKAHDKEIRKKRLKALRKARKARRASK